MPSILVTHTARFLRGPDDHVYSTQPWDVLPSDRDRMAVYRIHTADTVHR